MTLDARKIRLIMELRAEGISDTAVLGAIERVPREAFVPEEFHDQAYENTALPIGHGQTISQPSVVAYMSQILRVGPRMRVLEIGTGCGYQAAVLSHLCKRVYTVERVRPLLRTAEQRFRDLRLNNIVTRLGDGARGWPEQAPFERIIVTAAAPELPEALTAQLAEGGVMVLPIGSNSTDQRLVRCEKTEAGEVVTEDLWPVRFVPLIPGAVERQSRAGTRR